MVFSNKLKNLVGKMLAGIILFSGVSLARPYFNSANIVNTLNSDDYNLKTSEIGGYSPSKFSVKPVEVRIGASVDRFNTTQTATLDALVFGNAVGLNGTWSYGKGMTEMLAKASREQNLGRYMVYGEINTSAVSGCINLVGRLDYHTKTSFCDVMPQLNVSKELVHGNYSVTPAVVFTKVISKRSLSSTLNCGFNSNGTIVPSFSVSDNF